MEGVITTSTSENIADSTTSADTSVWYDAIETIFRPTQLSGTKERQQYVTDHKGRLITELLHDRRQQVRELGPADGYGHKVRLVMERASDDTPLVLRTEFKTDGLVLQLVASDTRYKTGKKKIPYRYHVVDEVDSYPDQMEQVEEVKTTTKSSRRGRGTRMPNMRMTFISQMGTAGTNMLGAKRWGPTTSKQEKRSAG
jgi:hypothetical protein